MFFEGSERKEAFLDQRNIGSENHQNFHIFKEISSWFLSKNEYFLILSFYSKWIKKHCFLEVPKVKKLFLKQKNIGSINHQNLHFFQRG